MRPEDAALLARVPPARLAANGVPDPEVGAARQRAAALVEEALADLLRPGAIRVSPLGAGWSRDIDVHVSEWPDPARLRRLGWLSLDELLRRLGGDTEEGRWAVVDDGEVLACADLTLGAPPDPVRSLLSRCRRRGVVRAREVLELRVLARAGRTLPADDPVIRLAARAEAGLGGDVLASWADGPPVVSPAELPWAGIRRARGLRRSLRPRLVVAVSGVDGAGKSTLCRALAGKLQRAGLPASMVWTRPGMGLGWFTGLARGAKRFLGKDPAPGVRRVAAGKPPSWRRGVLGWTWALLVTLAFLADVRRQHIKATGILLYDRHLTDALVTLDFVYEGVDLRVQRALIRRFLPRATVAVYLEVPPDVAVARKPGDVFGDLAVRRQLEGYDARRHQVDGMLELDGTRPAEELARIVFRQLVEGEAGPQVDGGRGSA